MGRVRGRRKGGRRGEREIKIVSVMLLANSFKELLPLSGLLWLALCPRRLTCVYCIQSPLPAGFWSGLHKVRWKKGKEVRVSLLTFCLSALALASHVSLVHGCVSHHSSSPRALGSPTALGSP